jgi:hypothetical protein
MCPVCQERAATVGVLCAECRDEISASIRATSEQVQLLGPTEDDTDAALVDVWGRPHPLSPSTLIGRSVDGCGLAVLEASISRHHARIELAGETWTVRDLGSANGTYVDDQPTEGAVELRAGARVRFGQMAFYFLPDIAPLPMEGIETSTVLIKTSLAAGSGERPIEPDLQEERTDPGLPTISLKLHEPAGGGSGFVELEGKQVQLTATQLELISIMMRRMTTDTASPPLVRGFVRSSELVEALTWDTTEPNENHVKQLVRRVRRALMKVAQGDLIESRHRFGYRLRAIPRTD